MNLFGYMPVQGISNNGVAKDSIHPSCQPSSHLRGTWQRWSFTNMFSGVKPACVTESTAIVAHASTKWRSWLQFSLRSNHFHFTSGCTMKVPTEEMLFTQCKRPIGMNHVMAYRKFCWLLLDTEMGNPVSKIQMIWFKFSHSICFLLPPTLSHTTA